MRHTLIFLGLVVFLQQTALAARIQILHTNDMHSFFEGTRDGLGGYARLKTLADRLKSEAKAKGLETLFLDGGDFAEGASFYFADRGADSLRMLDHLGIDISVIGNHDTMQGGGELLSQINRAQLKAQILSANLNERLARTLSSRVKPMAVVNIAGLKIGVAGFTTAQMHYQYAVLEEGKILPPNSRIAPIETQARAEKVNFLIGLTHIGLPADRSLVKNSRDFGLIVGGHSHTRLNQPTVTKNRRGKNIPIVQAGANSIALGEMIIDINADGTSTIVSYKLHSIDHTIARDPRVVAKIGEAKQKRAQYFGREWNEPVGSSRFTLQGQIEGKVPTKASCWGQHIAQFTRESTGADIGIHASGFNGDTIPAGDLSFGDLIDSYPHLRKFDEYGWKISTARVPGVMIKTFVALLKTRKDQFGMDYSLDPNKRIELTKTYVMAFPAELWYAIQAISPKLAGFLKGRITETPATMWESMEIYVGARSPLECAN